MAKLTFRNAFERNRTSDLSPFTMNCRIKDNVAGYQFDNIRSFKGQTAVSFDFVPQFSWILNFSLKKREQNETNLEFSPSDSSVNEVVFTALLN